MKEQLITCPTAILAKEKGFDVVTDLMYATTGQLQPFSNTKWSLYRDYCHAPTQSLLQKWLREQYYLNISVLRTSIGSDEWVFAYRIDYLPKEYYEAKRRCVHFVCKESYRESPGGTYWGGWDSYEEALENGLLEALKLI